MGTRHTLRLLGWFPRGDDIECAICRGIRPVLISDEFFDKRVRKGVRAEKLGCALMGSRPLDFPIAPTLWIYFANHCENAIGLHLHIYVDETAVAAHPRHVRLARRAGTKKAKVALARKNGAGVD